MRTLHHIGLSVPLVAAILTATSAAALHLNLIKADDPGDANLNLGLPVLDMPFNALDGGYPSMDQSLAITKDIYQLAHYGVKAAFGQHGLGWGEVGVRGMTLWTDVILLYLPGGDAWLHEEWHRAVMRRRGIDSCNGVYDMNIGASSIPVRKVTDDDLIALKRDHPADMIRLPAAGIEGSLELITALEKDSFFRGSNVFNTYANFLSYLSVISYVQSGATSSVNEMHEESNDEEEDMDDRDFVGHDFNSWVYDLFRPEEPYEARGTHPHGNGIRRYRDTDDLSEDEKDFMHLQGRLAYLNLLDPFLFSVRSLQFGDSALQTNLSVRHQLTAFGYVIDQHVFLRRDPFKMFIRWHHYFNYAHYFPGLELEFIDHPLPSVSAATHFSLRLGGWLQPKDQEFKTARSAAGGLAGLRLTQKFLPSFAGYAEVLSKTQGWVAGTPYLERAFATQLGVEATLN